MKFLKDVQWSVFKYVNIPLLDLDAPLPYDKLTETVVVVVLGHMLRAQRHSLK